MYNNAESEIISILTADIAKAVKKLKSYPYLNVWIRAGNGSPDPRVTGQMGRPVEIFAGHGSSNADPFDPSLTREDK